MKKPSILFLMCDELRADLMGFAGNKIIRTPHLDRLARDGVIFENCYTPSPICVPARQCMMSGQYSKTCHCEKFGDDLTPEYMTFARQFTRFGYNTTVCGKLHHTGIDQMQGWKHRIGMDVSVKNTCFKDIDQEAVKQYARPFKEVKWDQIKEVKRATIGYGPMQSTDDYTVDGAVRFIRQLYNDPYHDRENRNTPVFLKVSLVKPHYPYTADEELFMYYLNRVKPYIEDIPFDHPAMQPHRVKAGVDASEREIRRATACYYSMVEESDRQFGRVLDALDLVGQDLDDWIVVFTSDHGEMLGQHGVWEKQKFYDGSAKVPLMIRWPRRFGHRIVQENVNLCDLFATLCDLAELPIPDGLESRSMVPLMEGHAENWNNETVSQFDGRHLMIKWGSLKYQYYGDAVPEMLFDLEKNPEETMDFIADPAYEKIVEKFRERRAELGYGSTDSVEIDPDRMI